MSQITLRHLRLVQQVLRQGSLTGAARQLGVSQPAVSRGLSELEEIVGLRLFDRSRTGAESTAAGELMAQTADQVLGALSRAERQLRTLAAGGLGTLRIGTQCYTAYPWLPEILVRLRRLHPEIELQVIPEATRNPQEHLLRGELDLAITYSPPTSPDLVATPVFRDELLAVVALTHRLALRRHVTAEDFVDEDVILHFRGTTLFEMLLDPAGVTPRRVSELQMTEAVLGAAKTGLGIAILARWIVAPELRRRTVVGLSLGERGLWRTWSVTRRRGHQQETVIAEIARQLRELDPPRGHRAD